MRVKRTREGEETSLTGRETRNPTGDMPIKRNALLLAIIFLLCFPSLLAAGVPQSKSYFYDDSRADALIRHGLKAAYNLEYLAANHDWDELIKLYPEHPAGYVYKAALVWWQALEERENESLETRYDRLTKSAIEKGLSWIQKNPRDKTALAYLASAYGNAARFDVTITHSYLSALRNGKKGHKYIEKAHQLDKDFYDAYIGIGSYNYFTGALPAVIKPFAWLLGARGDKNEGLRQLLIAAEKGEYAQTEAKIVLLSVYITERRWDDYQRQLEALVEEYPFNHVLYLWCANHYNGMKRWDAGIAEFGKIEKKINVRDNPYSTASLGWLRFHLARIHFGKQDASRALKELNDTEQTSNASPVLLAQVYLLKGNVLDALNRRNDAVSAYQKVLEYPDIEESHSKAKRYLKSKFTFY